MFLKNLISHLLNQPLPPCSIFLEYNHIGGTSLECSRLWVRVKPKTKKLVFVASGQKAKAGWLGIRIMCPTGVTCLPADCCFSEIAL